MGDFFRHGWRRYEKTGGTFLIEKMPDPSAIWTRGNDKHTEWGGRKLKLRTDETSLFK